MKRFAICIGIILIVMSILLITLNFVGFLGSNIHSDDDTYFDGSIKTIEKDFEPRSDLIKLKIEDPVGKIDIEGYDGDVVKIRAEKHVSFGSIDKIKVNIGYDDDTILISTKMPHHLIYPVKAKVYYEIKIPNDLVIEIDAETDVGSINVHLKKCCDMDLKTDTGSITVKIPKDSDVKIDAESDVGNIYCDLPLEMKRETREIVGHKIVGVIGSGRYRIKLKTDVGSIKIKGF